MDDTRARLKDNIIVFSSEGYTTKLERDGMYFVSRAPGTVILIVPFTSALPIGLRFTVDNTDGGDEVSVQDPSGNEVGLVSSGIVIDYIVSSCGELRTGSYTA